MERGKRVLIQIGEKIKAPPLAGLLHFFLAFAAL
jgi:hypothetical protein